MEDGHIVYTLRISATSTSKLMYTPWDLAMLYIIELNTPAYIAFGSPDNIIKDITNDIIEIE